MSNALDSSPAELSDDERLKRLGFSSSFKREMGAWANFALGFTYLSPVGGIYIIFAVALATGGPPMIWALVIAALGQLLVALVFGEVVSQFPVAGGVYPWARRLWGKRWGWSTGWVYMVALFGTLAALIYGASPYVCALFGLRPTTGTVVAIAISFMVVATALNFMGTRNLAIFAKFGFWAEIIGVVVIGGYLILFAREQSLTVIFDSFGAGGDGHYLGAFLAAGLIGLYQYFGFEACGDVAEEVPDPSRRIPKTMRMTLYVGGVAATFICLAFILAITDIGAVIRGEDTDPIFTVLTRVFGEFGSRVVLVIVMISFLSATLSLQAAASRLMYSYARDNMIAGSKRLSKISERHRVPAFALTVAGIVPSLLVLVAFISTDTLTKIVSFATVGIYVGFQMVVLAALRARLKGWKPAGPFTMGRWGLAVNVAALVYGIAAILVMAWPRTPDVPFFDNYIVSISMLIVIAAGVIYMMISRHAERSTAPFDDAIPSADYSRLP